MPSLLKCNPYPETLDPAHAVAIVYDQDIRATAAFLKAGLSVLVECEKNVVDHIHRPVLEYAGRQAVLDSEPGHSAPDDPLSAPGAARLKQLEGLLVDLKDHETLVLPYLDLLAAGPESHLTNEARRLVELIYRCPKASLLGFVDPTLPVPAVVAARFPVFIALTGLPRSVPVKGADHPVLELITRREERDRCADFDPTAVFKHVAGFNPVQYRDGMRFVQATARHRQVSMGELISVLQGFKRSSGDQAVELPDRTFADIGGYKDLKQDLAQIAKLIAGEPVDGVKESMRRKLIPRGLLLHGPPGSGKTLIAKAIAHEMKATIQIVSGPEVMNMYVGESERRVRTLFANARRNAPSVIIFDEFDAIASQRTEGPDGGSRAGNAVVAQLLTELDGFREDDSILVVATTNRIDIIDEALLRPSRFRPIEVPLP
ncbi:MAG: 26S protease regulatory subunit, partial [bacterium]|nr:26S protease regulatory subunit [bacterium]